MPIFGAGSVQVVPGTGSVEAPSGSLIPWYRPQNYFPNALRAAGPGGIQPGRTNPAFPAQTGSPGGSVQGATSNAIQVAGGTSGSSKAPFSFTDSPVPMLLLFLVISIVLLRFVHYGY